MVRLTTFSLTLLGLAGCPTTADTGVKDTEDSEETGGTESDTTVDSDSDTGGGGLDGAATWNGTGVTVVITGGTDTYGYDFGMAQTGSDNGWAGEDCLAAVPAGYDYMLDAGYQFCHHFPKTGGSLVTVNDIIDVTEGESTLLSQALEATITYVLFAQDDTCVTWGDDTGYYADSACTPL